VGKTRIKRSQALIEPDLVYPLLRGRDVSRWRAKPSASVLLPQSRERQREGIPENIVKTDFPYTYAYLRDFEELLAARADRRYYPEGSPFYTMRNVAEYTFAPYKVVWREQAGELTAAVATGREKCLVPDHKLMLVECARLGEANYLCAALNCSPSRLLTASYVVETQTSTHVLEHVAIPRFDPAKSLHRSLSALSQRAHQLAALGKEGEAELGRVEQEIDRLAAELWGITQVELEEIGRALAELD
jgi:hypothetical protein